MNLSPILKTFVNNQYEDEDHRSQNNEELKYIRSNSRPKTLSVSISPSRTKSIVTEDNNHQVLEIKDKKDDNIGKHVVSPRIRKSTTQTILNDLVEKFELKPKKIIEEDDMHDSNIYINKPNVKEVKVEDLTNGVQKKPQPQEKIEKKQKKINKEKLQSNDIIADAKYRELVKRISVSIENDQKQIKEEKPKQQNQKKINEKQQEQNQSKQNEKLQQQNQIKSNEKQQELKNIQVDYKKLQDEKKQQERKNKFEEQSKVKIEKKNEMEKQKVFKTTEQLELKYSKKLYQPNSNEVTDKQFKKTEQQDQIHYKNQNESNQGKVKEPTQTNKILKPISIFDDHVLKQQEYSEQFNMQFEPLRNKSEVPKRPNQFQDRSSSEMKTTVFKDRQKSNKEKALEHQIYLNSIKEQYQKQQDDKQDDSNCKIF